MSAQGWVLAGSVVVNVVVLVAVAMRSHLRRLRASTSLRVHSVPGTPSWNLVEGSNTLRMPKPQPAPLPPEADL